MAKVMYGTCEIDVSKDDAPALVAAIITATNPTDTRGFLREVEAELPNFELERRALFFA